MLIVYVYHLVIFRVGPFLGWKHLSVLSSCLYPCQWLTIGFLLLLLHHRTLLFFLVGSFHDVILIVNLLSMYRDTWLAHCHFSIKAYIRPSVSFFSDLIILIPILCIFLILRILRYIALCVVTIFCFMS